MSNEKSSPSPASLKNEHHKLISYLDEFGKQISTRKSNSHTLEQQLSSLSKAYNNAQQKLLETERALLEESVLLEKQRTIIEIYKHILRENMEDEGIVTFIQSLEEDEAKKDIFEELQQIKGIINKKKLSAFKKSIEEDRTLKELKKEISRLYDQRSSICDESEMINSENYDLKVKIDEITKEKERFQTESSRNQIEKEQIEQQLKRCQSELEMLKEEIKKKNVVCGNIEKRDEEIVALKTELQEINSLLTQKLSISCDISKQNKAPNQLRSTLISSKTSNRYFLSTIESTISHLLKYKHQYKKLKENYQNNEFIKKELSLLKLFLSEEALTLVKEYEDKKIDCLEGELRSLAMMERNKTSRLEDCEREVWKYKLQMMREEQNSNLPNIYLTQSLKPNLLSSIDCGLESNRHQTQPLARLIVNTSDNRSISEFSSDQ